MEFANDGTFFFDEVGEMSLSLQAKLLRLLEEHKIRRIGGQKEIKVNIRIIAATNHNLDELVELRKFRKDLYYRLNTISIKVPPLRDRKEDVIPLFNHFVKDLCSKEELGQKRFTADAEEALIDYEWPGNVRELQNVIKKSYFLSSADLIQVSDLPFSSSKNSISFDEGLLVFDYKSAKEKVIEKFEVEYLTHYIRKNDGNISRTAEDCGLDRRSIHRLVSKYNIIYKE